MLGGAAAGSFSTATLDTTEDATFELYYGQLAEVVRMYNLQGLDLDVEQSMSLAGIERLVRRLVADFGEGFVLTLAPVASALSGGANLSGFNYSALQTDVGDNIAFLNAQFYNGFGSLASPTGYENVVNHGYAPSKVVAGQLTTGTTTFTTLNTSVIDLRDLYGDHFGGIMGWEYFNSAPGGEAAPWEWAQEMTAILRPEERVSLTITEETASRLTKAWEDSVPEWGRSNGLMKPEPDVDYFGMVNA